MSDVPKILYIDDEEDLVNLAESFFLDEQISIDTSTTFQHALEKIKSTSYDLIISDARMPTGSGLDLLKLIKKENLFGGKFILVTGNVENHQDHDVLDCDRVIYKPLRFQELVDEVKVILSKKL